MYMNPNEIFHSAAGEKPKAQIEAEKTAEEVSARFSGEGMKIVTELLEEVESMNLASRFNEDTEVGVPVSRVIQTFGKKDEASFKKRQLSSDLKKIQSDLGVLTDRLKFAIMDIKASQAEDSVESAENELSPEELGLKFNTMDFSDFKEYLRKKVRENSSIRFAIVANWKDLYKTRSAKALLDTNRTGLNLDSITIRATRQQFEEDVNAFASGVEWEEI